MMKYVPRDMGKSADSSAAQGKSLSELVKLILIVAALAVGLYLGIGVAVDAVVARLPADSEKRIFSGLDMEGALAGKKQEKRLIALGAILDKLKAQPEVPPLDYHLFLIDDPKPNAVAVPGGAIGVTRGLLDKLEHDETAEAFVIGHELGHFKHRDHLRGLGRAVGFRICYAILFNNAGSGGIVGSETFDLVHKKYSRNQELNADRFGLLLVYKTYGRVQGADRLFDILEKQDKTPVWAYMFATHPAHKNRIAELKRYAKDLAQNHSPEK